MPRVIEDVDSRGWCRPVLLDDWGDRRYYLCVIESDSGTRCHRDQDPQQEVRAGDLVRVLWPDATETGERVGSRPVVARVTDHGNRYEVHTAKLGVCRLARVGGVSVDVFVPIESLRVKASRGPEDLAAERAKALRLDPTIGPFTCDGCLDAPTCPHVFDPYNVGGDCLAEK